MPGVHFLKEGPAKYEFIHHHRHQFSVVKRCRTIRVSISSYYHRIHGTHGWRERENQMLIEEIKEIFEETQGTYGGPRITDALKDKGYTCSRPKVARLLRNNNIRA